MNFNEIQYHLAAHFVTIDGLRVAYVDTRPGGLLGLTDNLEGPVVFLHGEGATLDWFGEAILRIAPARRVIAIDLVGFGKSDKPLLEDAIPSYLDLLEKFFAELRIPQTTMIGHSMGCAIAASYALEHPDMVRGLVLISPIGVVNETEAEQQRMLDTWSRKRLVTMTEADWREWYAASVFKWTPKMEEIWRLQCELAKEVRFREWANACEAAVTSVQRHALGDRLKEIGCPTLVMWGAEDPVSPHAIAADVVARFSDARLVTLPDCGHLPMFERPGAFVDELVAFVAPGAAFEDKTRRAVEDVKPWPGLAPEIGRLVRQLADARAQAAKFAGGLSVDELHQKTSADTNSVAEMLLRIGGSTAWYFHELLIGERMPAEVASRFHLDPDNKNAPLAAPRQDASEIAATVASIHEKLIHWLEGREDDQLDRIFVHRKDDSAATLRWVLWHLVEDAVSYRGQIGYACRLIAERR